ncbi:unnamed protein product [Cuscuta epithymum]|uniref:Uncharacterized protein n=1 Tax=Cuscuta epithymum TaxID=186058 RepID=A0AAV0CRW9_9ASTE|nr:unnamed protein product [Cuscuta epithymum]
MLLCPSPVTLFTNDVLDLFEYACMDPDADIDLETLDAKLQALTVVAGVKRTKSNEEGLQGNPYIIVCVSQASAASSGSSHAAPPVAAPVCAIAAQTKRKLSFKSLNAPPPTPDQADLPSKQPVPNEGDLDELLVNMREKRRRNSNP